MKYSDTAVNLSRTTPFRQGTLQVAEAMLERRGWNYSQSALSEWCSLAAKQNINLLDAIRCVPFFDWRTTKCQMRF
jgi:hypothetical protein